MSHILAAGVAAAIAAGALVGVLGSSAAQPHRAPSTILSDHWPANTLRLPAKAVAQAVEEAWSEAPHLYPGRGPAVVTQSDLAPYGGARGLEVKAQCGVRAFHRTAVVRLLFPKELPSASLSQGVVFVSRLASGYKVWEVAH